MNGKTYTNNLLVNTLIPNSHTFNRAFPASPDTGYRDSTGAKTHVIRSHEARQSKRHQYLIFHTWIADAQLNYFVKGKKTESLYILRNSVYNSKSNSCFLFHMLKTNGSAKVCFCKNKYSATEGIFVTDFYSFPKWLLSFYYKGY